MLSATHDPATKINALFRPSTTPFLLVFAQSMRWHERCMQGSRTRIASKTVRNATAATREAALARIELRKARCNANALGIMRHVCPRILCHQRRCCSLEAQGCRHTRHLHSLPSHEALHQQHYSLVLPCAISVCSSSCSSESCTKDDRLAPRTVVMLRLAATCCACKMSVSAVARVTRVSL
jgi:hypothetical protein